jgi:hypothetical protein
MRFLKPCKKCGKPFRPVSTSTKLCNDCYKLAMTNRNNRTVITNKRRKEERLAKEMKGLNSPITLKE